MRTVRIPYNIDCKEATCWWCTKKIFSAASNSFYCSLTDVILLPTFDGEDFYRSIQCVQDEEKVEAPVKRLVYRYGYDPDKESYPEDLTRIVNIFSEKGYVVSREDAGIAYRDFSEEVYCAGWMCMTYLSDDEIFQGMLPCLKEKP